MRSTKLTPHIAEIAGIFAADGSLQKSHLCLWGNLFEERDYYDLWIKPLFKLAFDVTINPHAKESNSVYGFYVCKNDILEYFNRYLGFPTGKKTYTTRVPHVIMNSKNPQIWSAFVRGFCDGDGTISFGRRYGTCRAVLKLVHTYPRIQLKSTSHRLIDDLSILLTRLRIPHSTCILQALGDNEHNSKLIQILGRRRLKRYIKQIGFNNPVHQTKYFLFKRYHFVPPYTNIAQRKLMIAGKLKPQSFYRHLNSLSEDLDNLLK